MKNSDYYEFLKEKEKKVKLDKEKIKSDFNLVFSILKNIIIFLLKLPFYLLLVPFYLISLKFEKMNEVLMKIFVEPFVLISKISKWFFEAKWTAYLICFLIFMYILEFLIFIPMGIFNNLLFSSADLFNGNFYTILTSIFFHANMSHIFSNLLALLIFGRIVEREFEFKVILLFLSSGIIANIISGLIYYFQNDFTPSIGASGGIAGLIIFAILLEPFALSSILIFPIPIFIIGWFLISLDIVGVTNIGNSNINNLAHIGGYFALLILFFFLEFKRRKKIIKGFMVNLLILILIYFILNYLGINYKLLF